MALFGDGTAVQTWEIMVTTIAAAATPLMAYKFRERRAKRPKTPHEALYEYYENYINRLEIQLSKKDILIEALDKQNRDQRLAYEKIIDDLEIKLHAQRTQLDDRQGLIDKLKSEIQEMQSKNVTAHQTLDKLKKNTPDIANDK